MNKGHETLFLLCTHQRDTQLKSNPAPLCILINNFSRHIFSLPYEGSFNVLKHVDADGTKKNKKKEKSEKRSRKKK